MRDTLVFKIVVCGDPAVNKTSLLNNFFNKRFEEKYITTVGVNILKEELFVLDKKGKRINVLLNPSTYHKEMIEQADRIKSFQIIKKNKKYFVHVVCEYVVVSQSLRGMTGVDLGINRPLSTVLVAEKIRFVILKNDKQKMMG